MIRRLRTDYVVSVLAQTVREVEAAALRQQCRGSRQHPIHAVERKPSRSAKSHGVAGLKSKRARRRVARDSADTEDCGIPERNRDDGRSGFGRLYRRGRSESKAQVSAAAPGPMAYRVVYSERVRQRLLELADVARQRGDCATVSGLSLIPGPMPNPPPPPRPPRPAACGGATSGGIFPSGGSMIIDVRLPVFNTELNTAL